MPMVEVDESELATLRAAADFIAKAEKIPEGRKTIHKLAKTINPQVRTEEDVAEEYSKPIKEEIGKLAQRLDGWDKRVEEYNANESWNKVKSDRSYTEEGMKQLREFADKNGIKNPLHAAAAWERENPATPVRPAYMGDSFSMHELTGQEGADKDALSKIAENPKRFEDEQVSQFFAEKRGSVPFGKQ